MSRKQLIHILDDAKLLQIEKDLTINIDKGNKYSYGAKKEVILYDRYENDVIVPFSYDSNFIRTERKILPQMNIEFEGKLRENQITVKSEAINFLNKHGSVIISAGCGFGKTSTSIFIATVIKLKTLVICNRIILMNQWKDAILKFCPQAKVQILKPKDKLNEDSDFYIINACNICKFSSLFFKTIGTVICDELHIIMAEKISSCMKFLFPRYLIGLSATPYRHDGLDSLIELYFGKNKIGWISPNKTYEGYIGGYIGILIIYFIKSYNFIDLNLIYFFGIFGDLFFSYIKRKIGIKDYSEILLSHGGVLDRLDAFFIAILGYGSYHYINY